MENSLPNSWVSVSPLEIAEKIRGVSYGREDVFNESKEDRIPVLRANGIEDNKITYEDLVYVKTSRINSSQLLREGDVLIAMSSGSKNLVGKTAQFFDDKKVSFGAFCGVLRPNVELNSKYFGYFFQSKDYRETISELAAGTNINNLKNEHFESLRIPIPPLPEQQRIVAKLDELMEKIDRSRARLDRIPKILKRFRQSILSAAVSGKLTEEWRVKNIPEVTNVLSDDLPMSWGRIQVRDLATTERGSIQSGPFGSNLLHSEFQDDGVLAIGIDNVLDGKFSLGNENRISHSKYEELKKYTARPLDVLITVMATVGRCCVVPRDIETAIITKHVYRISCNQQIVNPYFLLHCLRSSFVEEQINNEIQGVTRPGINGSILKDLLIPVPSIQEQTEILRIIDRLFDLADKIEARYTKAKAQVDKLPQSLLAKAFRGELVPQDENDEPASVLLERIREAKQEKNKPVKMSRAYELVEEHSLAAEPRIKYSKDRKKKQ